MRIGSVCSGIAAPEMAWKSLGWESQWCSEIEPFCCELLEHRHRLANLGDMTKITERAEFHGRAIDLLVGGTPCQSFSIAGLRKGLADPRGNLTLVYLQILDRARPKWMVWENVPGVLSDDEGRTFAAFLGGLAKLGYGFAYRVLDAQYVRVESHARAVPQRRRRVFVVGYLGDWRRAAAVLFERESLCGNPPPSRKPGQGVAGTLSARSEGGGGLGTDLELDGGLIPAVMNPLMSSSYDSGSDGTQGMPIIPAVSPALKARDAKGPSSDGDGDGACLVPIPFDTTQITSKTNRSRPLPGDPSPSLAKGSHPPAIAIQERAVSTGPGGPGGVGAQEELAYTLEARSSPQLACAHMRVRRLTPRECERLQGFPDDYTLIPRRRGGNAADGPRYKALGNSMAVNVMRWIGERIQQVEAMNG